MVEVSVLDIYPQSHMRIITLLHAYAFKRSPLSVVHVVPVWMSKLRIIKSEKSKMRAFSLDLCTGGMEVPLCDTWLKHVYCEDPVVQAK